VREKNIPIEVIEIKDTVIAFAWEPRGERFATVMTADAINPERGLAGLRTNINFYMLEKAAKTAIINNFKLIRTPHHSIILITGSIDKKQLNSIFWCPKGRFVAFANLGRGITQFEFEIYDCDYEGDNKDINKELNANIMGIHTGETFGTTDVEWDPTGRYIATSSSSWKHAVFLSPEFTDNSLKMGIKSVISREWFCMKHL
jgi:translation initiation factor 3 subunit B